MHPHWVASLTHWRGSKLIIYYSCHPQCLSTYSGSKKEKLYAKEKRGKGKVSLGASGYRRTGVSKRFRIENSLSGTVSKGVVFFASWKPGSSVGGTGREAAPGLHSNIQGLNSPK